MRLFYAVLGFIMAFGMIAFLVVVQILLSRFKSVWPGLILPILSFLIGFIITLAVPAFMFVGVEILLFLLPAPIFTIIYFIVRRKHKKPLDNELRNMRAQDL